MFGDIPFNNEFNGVGFIIPVCIFAGETLIDFILIGVGLSNPSSSLSCFKASDYFVFKIMSLRFKFCNIIFFLLSPEFDLVSLYFLLPVVYYEY